MFEILGFPDLLWKKSKNSVNELLAVLSLY